MAHLFKQLTIALTSLLLTSCFDLNKDKPEQLSIQDDFEEVKINDEYQMRIPDYMMKSGNLNADASLQYQNLFKETYIIVIDEPKDEVILTFSTLGEYDDSLSAVENYRDIHLAHFNETIDQSWQSKAQSLTIDGMDAELVELQGTVEGLASELYYHLTFIESREKLYMVMAWTFADRKKKYRDTFNQAARSFKLIRKNSIGR